MANICAICGKEFVSETTICNICMNLGYSYDRLTKTIVFVSAKNKRIKLNDDIITNK